ncbi:hypothetical protein TREES_T100021430 [Tupaia chinensis]|uniref:Uncharacterized protein n=1 Tax=Tupaia chinensis TaxID=246437 RepID=L9L1K5_TUPCH|nr:hypothetical protein TREES_T100021430 [Tupaia chinensis]
MPSGSAVRPFAWCPALPIPGALLFAAGLLNVPSLGTPAATAPPAGKCGGAVHERALWSGLPSSGDGTVDEDAAAPPEREAAGSTGHACFPQMRDLPHQVLVTVRTPCTPIALRRHSRESEGLGAYRSERHVDTRKLNPTPGCAGRPCAWSPSPHCGSQGRVALSAELCAATSARPLPLIAGPPRHPEVQSGRRPTSASLSVSPTDPAKARPLWQDGRGRSQPHGTGPERRGDEEDHATQPWLRMLCAVWVSVGLTATVAITADMGKAAGAILQVAGGQLRVGKAKGGALGPAEAKFSQPTTGEATQPTTGEATQARRFVT